MITSIAQGNRCMSLCMYGYNLKDARYSTYMICLNMTLLYGDLQRLLVLEALTEHIRSTLSTLPPSCLLLFQEKSLL